MKRNIFVTAMIISLLFAFNLSAATVAGTLKDLKGEALPLTKVFLKATDVELPVETFTDDMGGFSFNNVVPGEYTMTAESENVASLLVTLTILDQNENVQYELFAWEKPDLGDKLNKKWKNLLEDIDGDLTEDQVEELNKIIEKAPTFYNAYQLRGKDLFDQDKKDEAVTYFKKVLELNPYEPQANTLMARYYDEQQNNKEAVQYLTKVLYSQPNNPQILHDLADKYYILNNFKEAQKYYVSAIKYYPDMTSAPNAYYFLGACYLKTHQFKDALPVLEKFIEISPNSTYTPNAKKIVDALKAKFEKENKNNK